MGRRRRGSGRRDRESVKELSALSEERKPCSMYPVNGGCEVALLEAKKRAEIASRRDGVTGYEPRAPWRDRSKRSGQALGHPWFWAGYAGCEKNLSMRTIFSVMKR